MPKLPKKIGNCFVCYFLFHREYVMEIDQKILLYNNTESNKASLINT